MFCRSRTQGGSRHLESTSRRDGSNLATELLCCHAGTRRPAPGWLCWGSGWDLRVRGPGKAWSKGLPAFLRYPRHFSGRPRPCPDPFLPPTWVQRLYLVVGQVQDTQVSQGLQVLHSADAVSSQGEKPAEHREGSSVRWGGRHGPQGQSQQHQAVRGCNSNPPWLCQGKEGAPLSSDHGKRSPWGQELPIPQVGKAAQILNLLNLVLEEKKKATRFSTA